MQLQHASFELQKISMKLDCSMFENDFSMMTVKLDQALIMHANLPKLCQHTHFKQPSSLNHASFMLVQACWKLNLLIRGIVLLELLMLLIS